jgi:ABC-type multidrug transport system fused ATPase/permease subunit
MARRSTRNNSSMFSKIGRSSTASHLQSDVLGIAGTLFRGRQAAGAEKISSVADATRKLSENLSDIPSVQGYVESAAEQMEYLSDYVAENSLEQMVEDGAAFAKRHPLSTVAFAVALGYGFTKLLTGENSTERSEPAPRRRTTKTSARTPSRKRSVAGVKKARANGKDTSHAATSAS